MDAMLQDPVLYWLIWSVATVIGIIIGWSLRASYRERAILARLEDTEQKYNSSAHLFAQLKSQHEQKTAEYKKLNIEAAQLRERLTVFEKEAAVRATHQQLEAAQLQRFQAEAHHAAEKARLLEENIGHLRLRDSALVAEIGRLQEEMNGWKKLQRDFSGMLQQIQMLDQRANALDAERQQLRLQLDAARLEVSNLQNALALNNASPDGDSDSEDPDTVGV
jgi:chromosome segregation ATPase